MKDTETFTASLNIPIQAISTDLRFYSNQVLGIVRYLQNSGLKDQRNYMTDEALKSLKLAAYQLDYLADSIEYNE